MDNDEQIEYWNGGAGDQWVGAQVQMDEMLAPLSQAALAKANAQPGERVIDIGCGCGATTLDLGAGGAQVWGVDISAPMLELAKQRAQNKSNLAFSQADAAVQEYTPDHDLVFSRFGVMFFADPVSAFANIRSALKPDGRMVFICWQPPKNNAWMSVAGRAVQPFLPDVGPPPDPLAPGPFAFADPERLRNILADAGFGHVQIDGLEREMLLAKTVDEALLFQAKIGPLARGLAELGDQDRNRALAAARKALTPYQGPAGIKLGAACWLVQATI